jgi:hypothetical protein
MTPSLSVDAERDVAPIELQTPDGWVDCDGSKDATCSITMSADGTVQFSFRTEPHQKMNVRAHNVADDLLFAGPVSLSLHKTDPDGADCPAECDVATGALPAS